MSSEAEARLLAALDPTITEVNGETFAAREFFILDARDDEARALGVECVSTSSCTLVVTDLTRRLGHVRIEAGGRDNFVFFDNAAWGGQFHAHLRILGRDCVLFFNDIVDGFVSLPTVFLRSDAQFLFWGRLATAVGCSIEVEGVGQGVVIGDDALISMGVWIRNYDMHAIHDLRTGLRLSRPPVDTVLERHVWLGQDVLLLNCSRIGMGAIIGARALVKNSVPPCVIAAGTPARVLRENASWGRDTYTMTDAERVGLGMPPLAET